MLNMYFVFGVPIFLLFLYATIAYVRKRTTIHYLGFILLIISGFMLVFNLQTWQQALLEMDKMTPHALSKMIGYPVYLICFIKYLSRCTPNISLTQNKITGRNRLNPISACFLNSNAYRSLVLTVVGIHNRE